MLVLLYISDSPEVITVAASTLSRGEVQSTSTLNDWAGYVDRINRQDWT